MPYKTSQYSQSGQTGPRHFLNRGVSFLGGAGLGALMMYLFDPESGHERRQHAREAATQAAYDAGETLGHTWHKVSDTVSHAGAGLATGASHAGESASSYGHSLADSARQAGKRLSRHAHEIASGSRGYLPHVSFGKPAPQHGLGSDIALAAGCLLLGVGAMYLMDPQRGRTRRVHLRDKFNRAMRQTGQAAYGTGRYLSDHARGLAAETRGRFSHESVTDDQLVARVRSEMGRVTSHPHAINISAQAGSVIVSGPILQSEADTLLASISAVRGVEHVEDRLQRHATVADIPALQGTGLRT